MSAKMNKVVARRYFEEFLNRGNLSADVHEMNRTKGGTR